MKVDSLTENINALLQLDANNSLSPHGIGGHARELLTQAANAIATLKEQNALLTAQVQSEQDGWKSVPASPSSDQVNSGADALRQAMAMFNSGRSVQYAARKVYEAMLDASPAHPQQVKSEDARDAERYRFMCGQGRYVPDPFGNGWAFGMGQECSKQALDAAIDAAISAQEPKG